MNPQLYTYSYDGTDTQMCISSYRYGFNGMEKDDEVKGGGNSYDFGARMYDSRLGRWLSIDPRSIHYVPVSPYHFSLNNPIIFIDVNGEVIIGSDGNEVTYTRSESGQIEWSENATDDVKKLGGILLSTERGTKLWSDMENHCREIHIHVVESGDGDPDTEAILAHQSKMSKESSKTMGEGNIAGEIVNGAQFKKIQAGTFTADDYDNENSGDEDIGNQYAKKNNLWDETHLIVNLDVINNELKKSDGVVGLTKKASEEQERMFAIGKVGAEEAAHTLQDVSDKGSDYNSSMHEIEAKKVAKKVGKQINKKVKSEIKSNKK